MARIKVWNARVRYGARASREAPGKQDIIVDLGGRQVRILGDDLSRYSPGDWVTVLEVERGDSVQYVLAEQAAPQHALTAEELAALKTRAEQLAELFAHVYQKVRELLPEEDTRQIATTIFIRLGS